VLTSLRLAQREWSYGAVLPLVSMGVEAACVYVLASRIRATARAARTI
jgi:hypothetical protein